MAEEVNKLNCYYYRIEEGCENRPICKYMRLDHLIQLLESGKFYVSRRKTFDDANESYKNMKLAFGFTAVGNNTYTQPVSLERIMPYSVIPDCPTSCWSKSEEEKYLMWKCYATEVGACIRSTVHNLIASLRLNLDEKSENKVVCGSMNYKDYMPSSIEEHQLFDKDKAYVDEEEFRFYFHLPSYNSDKDAKGILITVDTNILIDEIILSPFIKKDAADKLARTIKCMYNIDVKQSRIQIK